MSIEWVDYITAKVLTVIKEQEVEYGIVVSTPEEYQEILLEVLDDEAINDAEIAREAGDVLTQLIPPGISAPTLPVSA